MFLMLCFCSVGFSGHINRSGKMCSGEKLERGHSRTEGLISFFLIIPSDPLPAG